MAKDIDKIAKNIVDTTNLIADGLTDGTINLTDQDIVAALKAAVENNTHLFGITAAFKPFTYNQQKKLYAPYYKRDNDKYQLVYIEDRYDYTTPEHEWFYKSVNENKRNWTNPFWGGASETYLISYSVPFYRSNDSEVEKEPIGTVTALISIKELKKTFESYLIGKNGFAAVTTGKGIYLYHPLRDYIISGKTLKDIASEQNDADRLLVAEKARTGQRIVMDHVSTTTKEESWLIVEPVPSVGWSVQNTFIKDYLSVNKNILRQQVISIIISCVVLFTSSLCFIQTLGSFSNLKLWILVTLGSLGIFLGIGMIWNAALKYTGNKNHSYEKLIDNEEVDRYIKNRTRLHLKRSYGTPFFVKTGCYIESINFKKTNLLSLSGYIWQKYPNDFLDSVKNFQFSPLNHIKISKISKRKLNNFEIIRSFFEIDVPVHISYSKYPLEFEEICIQILPANSKHLIFVPDFDSERTGVSVRFFGLDKKIVVPGWELTHSFFTMEKQEANSNFGLIRDFDYGKLPVLSLRIGMKRNSIDAFISNLTPLIVVAIILFLILLLPSDIIDTNKILGMCTSLFFVVVFSHLAIRGSIAIGELFYLEYFFLVMYIAIIIIPVRMLLVDYGIIKSYNMIFRTAYWPVLMSLLFIITALEFY
ncbi:MAG: hypothetical protein V8K32_12835 [Candidatus Electrothrix gigas]